MKAKELGQGLLAWVVIWAAILVGGAAYFN